MNPNENPTIKPDRLRQRRLDLKLSQEEVSERAGINQSTISQLERGEQVPTLRSLVSLSKVLGTSIEWLLGMTDDILPVMVNSTDLDQLELQAVMLLREYNPTQRSQLIDIFQRITNLVGAKEQ
jgi:transcriptional regulator with XRE-family HTH domain